jgi:hypothetical protein
MESHTGNVWIRYTAFILKLLDFLYLIILFIQTLIKNIIYFIMIYFITKEGSNTNYNFTYLN